MFSKSILVSAFAALAYAQSSVLSFTRVPNPVTAGEATAITYATNDTTSPVTIILRKGPSGNLQTVSTLTDSATGGQYIWTPSTSLENGVNYALQITQGDQFNYFGPFQIQGGGASSGASAPVYGTTRSGNSTMTATGYAGRPTGAVGGSSNSTMSRNGTATTSTTTRRPSSTGGSATDAPYSGGSPTGSGAGASSTGAAAMIGASSVALIFGAAAAVLMG